MLPLPIIFRLHEGVVATLRINEKQDANKKMKDDRKLSF